MARFIELGSLEIDVRLSASQSSDGWVFDKKESEVVNYSPLKLSEFEENPDS